MLQLLDKKCFLQNSLTAPMCLTNYLVAELALRNYEEAHDVLSRTEEILSTGFYLGNMEKTASHGKLFFISVFAIYPALCP